MTNGSSKLTLAKETAASAALQSVASSEVYVENARQSICRLKEFSPQATFSSLLGSIKSCLDLSSLHDWRSRQPSIGSKARVSLAAFIELFAPCCHDFQQLDCEDFLRLVLPRDDRVLREEVMIREPGATWQYGTPSGRLPPDVAFRLCCLIDAEVTFRHQLVSQRQMLRLRGVSPRSVFDALQEPMTLQRCLEASQCDALSWRVSEAPEDVAARGPLSLEALEWLLLERQTSDKCKDAVLPLTFPPFVGAVDFAKESRLSTLQPGDAQRSSIDSSNITQQIHGTPKKRITLNRGIEEMPTHNSNPALLRAHRFSVANPVSEAEGGLSMRMVLLILVKQGELDAEVEAARSELPAGLPQRLEAVFDALDCFGRGFITEMNLWQLMQDIPGPPIEFEHLCTLVKQTQKSASVSACNELSTIDNANVTADGRCGFGASLDSDMHSGRPVVSNMPGRLSLREFAHLALKLHGPERRALSDAKSDADARSLLLILRDSSPCPGCGVSTQRDSNAEDCPHVVCPICGIISECQVLASSIAAGDPHVQEALRGLRSFIPTAAVHAQECHHAAQPLLDSMCKGAEAPETKAAEESLRRHGYHFRHANQSQLRRMLKQQEIAVPSELVLQFTWMRSRLFAAQYGHADEAFTTMSQPDAVARCRAIMPGLQ